MRINKNQKSFTNTTIAIFIGGFIAILWFFVDCSIYLVLQDNNFFGFPIWPFLIVLFLIAAFINNVYSELKFNKKEPTRKNVIAQTKLSIIILPYSA